MSLSRRDVLKGAACTGLVLASGVNAQARDKTLPPAALGILYDATLCIGCQACMSGCKRANKLEPDPSGNESLWDNPTELSTKSLTVIKQYRQNETEDKAQTVKSGFIKRQCMHCVDPACVSACPVSAMQKDPATGIVTYNKKACIGCRYCQIACPYNVPTFEFDKPFPQIVKCQLCDHLLAKGDIAACCQVCPTGASLYGPVELLKEEAKRRLALPEGQVALFPANDIRTGRTVSHTTAEYQQHIYGEKELGGTQVLLLSSLPFAKLGLQDLPEESYAGVSENIQHTLYKGMILPMALLAGLLYFVKRNER
ncbi:MAG: hydrogenase 2 operon protein HybA [Desulfobulbaceae bacterium]|jgi:Fe-S-cluster-containing dehydrogenase component|nr:hydrogenase 2 operon protein HybA [Desulfobulbaceae bacterium]